MQFNPDLLLQSEGSQELLDGIRERLESGAEYQVPVSVLGLIIEDMSRNKLSDIERIRLLERARTIVGRSIRKEKSERRRMTDVVFWIDSYCFIVLYNADRKNYLIPLGRIVEALRQEAFAAISMAGNIGYKRNIVIGSATWQPAHGMITPMAMIGRVVEALVMAHASPRSDSYARLRISPSSHDDIKLYEYGWDEGFVLSGPEVLQKAREAEAPPAPPDPKKKKKKAAVTQRMGTAEQAQLKEEPLRKAHPDIRIIKPKTKSWWQFWK